MKVSGRSRCEGQKCEEECPEATIREGPEELTLKAEAVGAQKSCINVEHMADDRWRPPLVDADWHAFCQAIYKCIELKAANGRSCNEHYKDMSKAGGARKPSESQKARALWRMKAARDRSDEFL